MSVQCRERCGKGGKDKDGWFPNERGEKLHHLRAHTHRGTTWAINNSRRRGEAIAAAPVEAPVRNRRLIDQVAEILKSQHQGMHLDDIVAKLREQGNTTIDRGLRAQIATMTKSHPELGIIRVDRSVYGLQETKLAQATGLARQAVSIAPQVVEEGEIPLTARIAILQSENHRQREVLMRTIHALGEITLLATSPIEI